MLLFGIFECYCPRKCAICFIVDVDFLCEFLNGKEYLDQNQKYDLWKIADSCLFSGNYWRKLASDDKVLG